MRWLKTVLSPFYAMDGLKLRKKLFYVCSRVSLQQSITAAHWPSQPVLTNWDFNSFILQPFSPDYHLTSHTTCAECVDSERQIFKEIFHGNFIYSQRDFARNLLKPPKKDFFLVILSVNLTWVSYALKKFSAIPRMPIPLCEKGKDIKAVICREVT